MFDEISVMYARIKTMKILNMNLQKTLKKVKLNIENEKGEDK
jgi:hypothetical protein